MPQKLHIVAPDIHRFDAVGNHCLYLAEDLRNTGLDVQLYAQRFSPPDVPVHDLESIFTQDLSDSLLLVSYSIFDPYLERLLALPCRKLCYFHGVTPPELLRAHEPVKLVDTLVVGAFIEARSCERFAALVPHLDEELGRFYHGLLKSEARHYQGYLKLAHNYGDEADIARRVELVRAAEMELIQSPDQELRFHSGIPQALAA